MCIFELEKKHVFIVGTLVVVVPILAAEMRSALAASVFAAALALASGMCTGDERTVLQDAKLVGSKSNDCGVKAYNTSSFKFRHVEFNNCFSDSLSISMSCAECFASVVEYGMKNCFANCSTAGGWCASSCLSCAAHAWENDAALGACVGFKAGRSEPCTPFVPESTVNSSDPEIDRCSVCTDDCDGCPGHEKPIDNVVVKFITAHSEELKSQAQELAMQEGLNEAIQLFVPIRYKTQVVAGTNWFVKVQFGSNSRSNMYADVVIFEPLAFRNEPVKITRIKFGVARDAPISFLASESTVNSSDPESDRCSVCTDDCPGCPGHEQPIDNVVVKFITAHGEELKAQAQELATQEGLNEAIQLFVPIRYKTQVVAGTNWFLKVQFGSNSRSNMYADVVIFEPLAFRNEPVKITRIKFGVARDAPISFIANESLMV